MSSKSGVKFLLCAFEKSGKSTLTSALRKPLIINLDQKEYGFKVPHVNIKQYEGMDNLIELVTAKLQTYHDKFKEYPETVVFDTVTQMYSAMQKYNSDKYKGFDVHTKNNQETMAFNQFIEQQLIPAGINVVIVAHTLYDEATARHIIPATGAFAKAGSWTSVVNDAAFIEVKSNKLIVHLKGLKFPARTTLADVPDSIAIEDYSIQDHLDQLSTKAIEFEEYIL